jgi:hypothetical protein
MIAGSWGGDFYCKIGRCQGAKIYHVEGVDAIASRLLRAAQVNCIVNPASGPAADGTLANDFLILPRGKGHQVHMRENDVLDDLPRLTRLERRLERGSRQHRVHLGQTMGADTSAMHPPE